MLFSIRQDKKDTFFVHKYIFKFGNILHAPDLELFVSERHGRSLVTPESGESEGTQKETQHGQSGPLHHDQLRCLPQITDLVPSI